MILTEDTLSDWILERGGLLLTRRTFNSSHYDFKNSTQANGISYVCITGYANILRVFFTNLIYNYSNKIVVVIIESDTISLQQEWLDHPTLEHCYTWNKPFHHPKLSALPIGLNHNRQYNSITQWLAENKHNTYEQKNVLCMNCSLYTNPSRKLLVNQAKTKWGDFCDLLSFIPNTKSYYVPSHVDGKIKVNVTNPKCYDEWKKYPFVLSPPGAGIDCHRTWEALLVGCIPVVLSSNLDELYKDLPIVIVQSWDTISKSMLESAYSQISTNKQNNKYTLDILTLEYWQDTLLSHSDNAHISSSIQSTSTNLNNIHFITYGSGPFIRSKERLLREAHDFGEFKTIRGYGPNDLTADFRETHKDILTMRRGGGYWIWRPSILLDALERIKDNEYLIYLDAGCTLNKRGKKRFFEYIALLNNSEYGIMSFQMSGNNGPGTLEIEKKWTVNEIFDHFKIDINGDIARSGQYLGGILVMKKNKHLLDYLHVYSQCISQHPDLCTDKYNTNGKQVPEFIENRHEQSIASVLRKLHGSVVIDGDESWMPPFGKGQSLEYPFWATRRT